MKLFDDVSEIKKRLENRSTDETRSDIEKLFQIIAQCEIELAQANKKNIILNQHVAELTQEMENVRSDFGGMR